MKALTASLLFVFVAAILVLTLSADDVVTKKPPWKRRRKPKPKPKPLQDDDMCGIPGFKPSVDMRIVGGKVAVPNSWPWQISLLRRNTPLSNFYHTCGGSLVATQWVVTAAHCVIEVGLNNPGNLKVILGEHDRSKREGHEVERGVAWFIYHELYIGRTNFWQNDIAAIKLAQPVTYNRFIRRVCLPTDDNELEMIDCYATGWGRDANNVPLLILNQVDMLYYNIAQCNQPAWFNGMMGPNMLCAGHAEGGKGTCQGDSGGPLVCRGRELVHWTLRGLTSWAKSGCAAVNNPTVFTRVSSYVAWINEVINTHRTDNSTTKKLN